MVNLLFKTSRTIVTEIETEDIYYTDMVYDIYLNNEYFTSSSKVVQTLYPLMPDREYNISFRRKGVEFDFIAVKTDTEFITLDVKRFGAKGDGVKDDTLAIQAAILACPKGGRVYISSGIYKVSSIFLKSDVYIDIAAGAVISAFTDRDKFPILPGLIESNDEETEYNLASWEGNPLDCFASIFTGIGVENVVISGGGTIDGNADYSNWWKHAGRIKTDGAFRPRMIFLNRCSNVVIHGIKVQNSPAWNLHPYFSNKTKWLDLQVLNPKDSPNTDGIDPESVNDIDIIGVYFTLGDDCIAIKSGKFYMGNKYKVVSENIDIRQCYMRNGHGSVTIGSEIAAGARDMRVSKCIFENTDRGLRIKTRRGRGKNSVIDNVTFEDIKMDGVLTPFVASMYYWCCDPDGKSKYVSSKEPLPIDERTPSIKGLHFKNIVAKNAHVAGSFIYGLPENRIKEVSYENVTISYAENPISGYPSMMADIEKMSLKGIYINNVEKVVLNNVKISGQDGEGLDFHNIDEIIIDGKSMK